MRIVNTKRNILDTIIEITAEKTKLLLSDNDLKCLTSRHEYLSSIQDYLSYPNTITSIRGEELEEDIISLRKAVGNLKNFDSANAILFDGINQLAAKGYDMDALNKAMRGLSKKTKVIDGEEIVAEVAKEYSVPTEALLEYVWAYSRYKNLSIISNILQVPDYRDWDGIRPLDSLFQTEILPKSAEKYFDQEFINYLYENNVDLEKINWRNFERLIAEFFNSNNYFIKLGPGKNDGGVDVRVWSDKKSSEGPPLILIQCKRYRKKMK